MARLNKKTIREALKNSGGNMARMADALEVGRSAVSMYFIRHPDMKPELDAEKHKLIDIAEDNIDTDIVLHHDVASSKWKLLNSKEGRARGYGAKTEIEHSGTQTRIIIDKADNENNTLETKPKTRTGDGAP